LSYLQRSGEIEVGYEALGRWPATIQQIRECVTTGTIVAPGFGGNGYGHATQGEVQAIQEEATRSVQAGRLIDFGHFPNDVMSDGGNRGGPLYTQGFIGHPFRDPWLLFHTWEGGSALYLVSLLEDDRPAGGDCEVVELQPLLLSGKRVLMVCDRALLTPDPAKDRLNKYTCKVMPSAWRFLPEFAAMNNGISPQNSAAGNVLDPLMTALLMLSTNGVPRETVRVDPKLNRARLKSGKQVIPPYDRVRSGPYVTALQSRGSGGSLRSVGGTGTHASPIAHLRRGHIRTYADGKRTFIRDSLVNFTDEAKAAHLARSHYVAVGGPTRGGLQDGAA
jgi:hypothetical protein